MEKDRRKYSRYVIKKDAIQIFCDDAILFGKLYDLSNCGLSFKYNPFKNANLVTNCINILVDGKEQLNLYHIYCRTIYDIPSKNEVQRLTGYEKRKCGIKFDWVNKNHKRNLNLLLRNYSVESIQNV